MQMLMCILMLLRLSKQPNMTGFFLDANAVSVAFKEKVSMGAALSQTAVCYVKPIPQSKDWLREGRRAEERGR